MQLFGTGSNCRTVFALYWTTIGLQFFCLLAVLICFATQRVHSFRSTLWSMGGVAFCLSTRSTVDGYSVLPLIKIMDVSSLAAPTQASLR